MSIAALLLTWAGCGSLPVAGTLGPQWVDDDGDGIHARVDCDDTDASVAGPRTYFADADRDGYVVRTQFEYRCEASPGWSANPSPVDCSDSRPGDNAPRVEYLDNDRDGFGNENAPQMVCFSWDGSTPITGDCDDIDRDVHPGEPEICDGADQDCDGEVDDGGVCGLAPWQGLWHTVTDAEYDATSGSIITVSGPEASLFVTDLATGTEREVALDRPPTALSLSPTPGTAVAGSDGWVSVLDLVGASVTSTRPVGTVVTDIVADTGHAYVFEGISTWATLTTADLTTGEVTHDLTGSIHGWTKAKLHPDGQRVYGADNGVSPSDIERYELSGGTLTYVMDSPYHGTYPVNGDLWIHPDGSVVFTRGGTVFDLDVDPVDDLTYGGTLEDAFRLAALAVIADDTVVAIDDSDHTTLRRYHATTYAETGRASLPSASSGHTVEGRFLFAHADGVCVVGDVTAAEGETQAPWAFLCLAEKELP
ncbi:MAG: putative metal-binding motif-containing protein [Myxococcales bacterium]|nr:putative metal-binding motif-containing protein [Myxococcales bacterium]